MSISSTAGMGRASMRPGNSQQRVLAAFRVVTALQAGRGRAQDHARARGLRAHDGHVAPVVARRLLLLVAAVVLFVHHDQAQIPYRREHSGARPHHHAAPRRSVMRRHCSVRSTSVNARVQDGHAVAEA